jgi:hypothetical protein
VGGAGIEPATPGFSGLYPPPGGILNVVFSAVNREHHSGFNALIFSSLGYFRGACFAVHDDDICDGFVATESAKPYAPKPSEIFF